MEDYRQQYELWDKFLTTWPRERLRTMTLDEYTRAGSKESFTYWIESRLDKMGSIWGGSSFKFGVFSRKDTEGKTSDAVLSYSNSHGWYSSLGTTAEEAFEKVRSYVAEVADLASEGKLDEIDSFEHLGDVLKWKIAFHYQDRQFPVIVDIFKRAPLAMFVGGDPDESMAKLQRAVLAKKPADLGILEFGTQVWDAWSRMIFPIWKLSHGNPPVFTDAERQQYLQSHLAVMDRNTGRDQGKKFAEVPTGTLFFLCHGNSPQCIGQFTSEAIPSSKGEGWLQRSYRLLKSAQRTDRYTDNSKAWSPQGNTTFWQVGDHDLPEFESTLLKPYFNTDLAELAGLADVASEPADSNNAAGVGPSSAIAPSRTMTGKSIATCINRIYYGPPGTGKTYTLNCLLEESYGKPRKGEDQAGVLRRFSFVTFHQSYGYEEFVEGLRPKLETAGTVEYEIRPGAFKRLCDEARENPGQRYAMVIDEINRGNISRIFGELITLIEADKRDPLDGSPPPFEVSLAYSGKGFSVPANVDIIGTMNTADRSLALLDTALRRRFEFWPLMPDTRAEKDPADPNSAPLAGVVVSAEDVEIDVRLMLERINERIEAIYDRDHCIGHAYFTGLRDVKEDGPARFEMLASIFRSRIVPLLEEYFFEDWGKIRLVLGDNQKQDIQTQFIAESGDHEQRLGVLFGDDHGLENYATKHRYTLQETAFKNPEAYIGIYRVPV
jgi:5-methylcytosine-specific restriction endonuclease McrBC GTP-binding regulatory subunit McrB